MSVPSFSAMRSPQPICLNRASPVRFSAREVEKVNPWHLLEELGLADNDYVNRGLIMRMMQHHNATKIATALKETPLRGEQMANLFSNYPEDLDTFIRDILQNNERFQAQVRQAGFL